MEWNKHYDLNGKHSFLSPSSHSWMKYSRERLRSVYLSQYAKSRGTKLHALASELINMGISLPRSAKTLNMFVNDSIKNHMRSEQPLYFSPHCFGTADAIRYINNKLTIFDLKTGTTPASMDQLLAYAAIFFLEYRIDPNDSETILRLYQNNAILEETPDPSTIVEVMEQIIEFSTYLDEIDDEIGDDTE